MQLSSTQYTTGRMIMNKKQFNRFIRPIWILLPAVTIIASTLVYFLSENIAATVTAFSGMLILGGLALLVHRLDDNYISEVVSDLSKLTDALTELEEREIFPENEDTVISKLQSKVIKLTKILKTKNEASLREQENIKSLVSDISHQLKTPLANLMMYVGFLEEEMPCKKKEEGFSEAFYSDINQNTLSGEHFCPEKNLVSSHENKSYHNEKIHEYVKIIRLSVDRLNFLSESMIKISRLESGLIHLDMQKQSLNETVLKAVKDIYAKAKKKNVEIIYIEEQNIILSHDRNWTAEAVFNLLDNAVKYSDNGAKVYLNIKPFGMFASIEVTDENAPISEYERTRIFTRFYRGQNSRNSEGIGVGLYLSREIAVMQGGYMALKVGERGNTFAMVLGR